MGLSEEMHLKLFVVKLTLVCIIGLMRVDMPCTICHKYFILKTISGILNNISLCVILFISTNKPHIDICSLCSLCSYLQCRLGGHPQVPCGSAHPVRFILPAEGYIQPGCMQRLSADGAARLGGAGRAD